MFDFDSITIEEPFKTRKKYNRSLSAFQFSKRAFDICVSMILLVPLAITAAALLALNPFYNRGPLVYRQMRMGKGCKPFIALKFRSMMPVSKLSRGADDPLEDHRITPLGRVLRSSRFDELPQVLNVLNGDMSLIGPRPDYIHHARRFLRTVPGYRARHSVRPGISGLAQTEVGYAAGAEATIRKVEADLYYIRHTGFRMETFIFWRTLVVVFRRLGC